MKRANRLKKLGLGVSLVTIAAAASAAPPNDGDYDTTWGNNFGKTSVAFDIIGGNQQDVTADSVVGPDGAMYLAGTVKDAGNNPRIGLAKLLPITGALDNGPNGFGPTHSGMVTSPAGFHATGLALRNNTLYVGGYQDGANNSKKFAYCVFSTSGVPFILPGPGTTCVSTAFPLSPASAQHVANDIAVQSDGKVVLGGYIAGLDNGRYSAFVRFNTNGTLDTTFGLSNSGFQVIRNAAYLSEEINAIGIASNGKIVGVGTGQLIGDNIPTSSGLMARVTSTGQPDSIGQFGEYSAQFDGSSDRSTIFRDVVLVPSNGAEDSAVVVGSVEATANQDSAIIAKITGLGALDASFSGGDGSNGYSLILSGSAQIRYDAIARQPGSGFVVAGTLTPGGATDVVVTRYSDTGSGLSNPLGVQIDFNLPGGGFDEAVSVNVASDAIYVAGWGTVSPNVNVDFTAAKLILDRIFADGFEG